MPCFILVLFFVLSLHLVPAIDFRFLPGDFVWYDTIYSINIAYKHR